MLAFEYGKVVDTIAVQANAGGPKSAQRGLDWTVLLQRTAAGDQLALAELYDATSTAVFGLALRILGEKAAAEDATVEVYAQVWAQAKVYDSQRGTPLAWLLTLTRSRALDLLRVRNRSQVAEPLETAGNVQATTPNPEEISVVAERHRLVRNALGRLSEEQRQAIELAYFSGLSHTEIANRLGQPLGTVKTRIRLGMIRLRELLNAQAQPGRTMSKERGI